MKACTDTLLIDSDTDTSIPILVVDDVGDNLDLMEAMLLGEGFQEVLLANSGRKALNLLAERPDIGVILMDLMMPEMDGFEICKRITCNPQTQHIPIIVVTGAAFRENDALIKSFAAGAVDFVSKPLNEVELFARIRVALSLYRERYLHRESLHQLAENESRFRAIIQQMPIGIAHIDGQGRLLVVNHNLRELLGLTPDEAVEGTHLRRFLPDLDTAGVEGLLDRAYLDRSQRLRTRLVPADGQEHWTLLTITLFSGADTFDSTFIVTLEDIADHHALIAYGDDNRLADQLHRALQHGEFTLYYQPQFNLKNKQLEAMKALLRWHHPDRGLLRPSTFLPQAQALGFDGALRDWVLREACTQVVNWQEEGLPPLRVAVSLSVSETRRDDLPGCIQTILAETTLSAPRLTLELVGRMAHLSDASQQALRALHDTGVRLALDDTGSEALPLRYLKDLPLSTVKLARELVQGAMVDDQERVILRGLTRLAHELDLKVIAKGVETRAGLEFVAAQDCDIVQGHFLSKPRPADQIDEMLSGLCRLGFSG